MAGTATRESNVHTADIDAAFNAVIEVSYPDIIVVPEMAADVGIRQHTARFIGEVMLDKTVEAAEELKLEKPISSLRDGIHWAAEGDPDGLKLVETNVATDVIERTLKSGHVMDPIPLKITRDGKIIQYNQTGDSIQANSLQLAAGHPIMRRRTEAEARNNFRIEYLNREGFFEEYSLVVFSLAEDLPDIFFTETMSCSIQVISKAEGGLQLEPAFVAGVAEKGAKPHDMRTIVKIGDMLGIDFRDKSRAEILDMPVLVRNEFIKDGAIDMVKLWDRASGTFFGENKPAPMSYEAYRKYCYGRTKSFQPKIDLIRDQLIAEAPHINTRMRAVERLHELSEAHMVHLAIEDESIDLRFLGPEAAEHAVRARYLRSIGEVELARQETKEAIRTADSKSCPWKRNSAENAGEDDSDADEGSDEDCDYQSKECPLCGEKDVYTVVRSLGKGKGRRVTGSCGCSKDYK